MTFGVSAYLAQMHAQAPMEAVEGEVAKLLAILGENDPALVTELTNVSVNRAVLADLILWNARIAPNPYRDRLGRAAALFWAAQTLVTTVMRPFVLDLTARYSPGIARAIERGADGLFDVGQSQFEALAHTVHNIAHWLARRKPRRVALIESPIGNSVPIQLLGDVLDRLGVSATVVVWNAPRNDKKARGRTVEEAGEACAAAVDGYNYVVLLDDALSGTRFVKLFDALVDRIGRDRFIPIAMMFDDTFRPELKSNMNRERLMTRLAEQALRIGYSPLHREFPVQRLFKMDGGNHVRWQSPVIWADSDLVAGKRKVNLIFTILDHCLDLLRDLGSDDSVFRSYLERAWAQNTAGQGFAFTPGLLKSIFEEIVTNLPLDEFRELLRNRAKQHFPKDYAGDIDTMDKEAAEQRWRWFRETFIAEAEPRIGEQEAGAAWHAIDDVFAASFPDQKPAQTRDADASPYTLPFNNTVCAFNRRLRTRLIDITLNKSE